MKRRPRRYGLLAVSPLVVLALLFVALSCLTGSLSSVPLLVVFLLASVYALAITRGVPLEERIAHFSRGAGNPDLLMMVWIFVLAGAFAASAKEMGAITATVELTLRCLPASMILPGLFIAACFISISVGTSVGTVVALVPVAAGVAERSGMEPALVVAAVVGGSFFGDNLSFISDTTVAATRSMGCELKDKFRANIQLVLPAALLTILLYVALGSASDPVPVSGHLQWIKVLPYVVVLLTAVMGMNVLSVLLLGCVLTGAIGFYTGDYNFSAWLTSMAGGIVGMGELIVVSMLAGGLLELVRYNGGIVYLIHRLTRRVRTKRGAELSIAALVSMTNLCTANNTVAILSVGRLAKEVSDRYGVDKRKGASILDTFSCTVQGLIPYGAQLLMAGGLSGLNPVGIISYLYYPMLMGGVALLAIGLRYPRKYS